MITTDKRNYVINRWTLYYKGKVFNVDELAQARLVRAKVMMDFIDECKANDTLEERLDELKFYIPDNQEPFLDDIINSWYITWKAVDWPVKLSKEDIENLLVISMLNQYTTYLTSAWLQAQMLPMIPVLQEDVVQEQEDEDKESDDSSE